MNPIHQFKASPRRFALTLSVLLVGVLPSLPRPLNAARESARSLELNRADREAGAGGYYEGLIEGAESPKGTRSELSQRLLGSAEWGRLQAAMVSRPTVHDFLQFDLWPNQDLMLFGHKFTTNPHGMRDRDYTVSKPLNTFRIVLLGSSIDMGWGVGDDETYENLLESWLNDHAQKRGIDRRFEVLNFAVAAYSPTQRFATLPRRAAAFEPDLVIYSATLLDARLLELHLSNLLLRKVDLTYPFLKEAISQTAITPEDIRTNQDRQYVHKDAAKAKIRKNFWPLTDTILGALGSECRSMDIPLMVVAVPRAGKADTPEARSAAIARLAGITSRHAIPFVDLTGAFDKFDVAQVELTAWDDHPNTFGHRRIFLDLARAIADRPELYNAIFDQPTAKR
jgi:hypothetical protein